MESYSRISTTNSKNIEINAPDDENYELLTNMWNKNRYVWYFYENRQNRPFWDTVRNLHQACNEERIIQDLRKRVYKIREVINE